MKKFFAVITAVFALATVFIACDKKTENKPSSEITRLEKEYEEALKSEDLGKIADSYSKLLAETIRLNNEEVSKKVSKFIEETSQTYSDTLEKAKENYSEAFEKAEANYSEIMKNAGEAYSEALKEATGAYSDAAKKIENTKEDANDALKDAEKRMNNAVDSLKNLF